MMLQGAYATNQVKKALQIAGKTMWENIGTLPPDGVRDSEGEKLEECALQQIAEMGGNADPVRRVTEAIGRRFVRQNGEKEEGK